MTQQLLASLADVQFAVDAAAERVRADDIPLALDLASRAAPQLQGVIDALRRQLEANPD